MAADRLSLALVALLGATAPVAAAPPNIVAILLDDLGVGEIGPLAHGSVTPNIDALAARGAVYVNGYSPAPMCGPSRVGMMTMRQPQEFGAYRNSPDAWLPKATTFANILRKKGYRTSLVGKWHPWTQNPLGFGFYSFYGFIGGEHDYWQDDLMRGRNAIRWTEYLTTDFTDEAIAILKLKTSAPKLVVVSYSAPHTPMQTPPGSACDPTNTRCVWLAMMSHVDADIGRLVAAAGNGALIVLAGDNGCDTGDSSCKAPLRGHKQSAYEGGSRVPFVVTWPGHVAPGQRDELVSLLDWGPTFLSAAGIKVPTWADGVNLLENAGHECLFWSLPKLASARCGQWKLVGAELYDLAADPREKTNIAATHPTELAYVRGKLEEAAASWIAPLY